MGCQKCSDRGYLLNENREWVGLCDCPLGIKHRRADWERGLTKAGIFSSYWHKTMGDFHQQIHPSHQTFVLRTQQTIGRLDAIRNTSFLWVIHGGHGTGKTLAGSLVLMEAIRKGYPSRYVIWSDLINKRMNHEDQEELELVKNVEFLVIDKVNGDSIRKDSKFPAETLDLILGYRYGNQKPTIVILDTSLTDARRSLPILGELAGVENVSEVEGLDYRTTTIK